MAELFLVPQPEAKTDRTVPRQLSFLYPAPREEEGEDAEARREALDTRRSFLVEAPAGSGKTALLIQRFLKLLTAENVADPAQVLAITFTRKATVELRDRVLAQLQAAATGREPEDGFDRLTRPLAQAAVEKDRQLGWNLLAYPRRLNIRTIDSVCAEIARSLPVLSGASAGLVPTERAEALHAEAARATVMLLGGDDPALSAALETLLLERDADLADCEALIAEMLAWREQWGQLLPLTPAALDDASLDANVLPKFDKALYEAICRGLTRLAKTIPEKTLNSLCVLASDMGREVGYKGKPSPIAICAGKLLPPGSTAEHLAHWRALMHLLLTPSSKKLRDGFNRNHVEFEIQPHHRTLMKNLTEELALDPEIHEALCAADALPPLTYPKEQWHVTKALMRVLSRALIELQLVFAEHGKCDFAELGLLARTALRRGAAGACTVASDLAHATGQSLQHLLVDEMQDTSTSQYELIQLLTQHWDGYGQTVFLVGDPKQSIYLFRQARVERFVETMQRGLLGELPLTTLHLSSNFRSQANLVRAFNEDFAQLFPAEPNPVRPELVPYVAAQARKPASSKTARVWHANPLPYHDAAEEQAEAVQAQRADDAEEIRRLVELWRSRPLPPGRSEPWKIAVLVRTRDHLFEIVGTLKGAAAIPYRAIEIEPLGERQEILDLLALTRALLHPADRTAWLALLRSPWCGLTLADLHILAGGDDESLHQRTILDLIADRGESLSPDGAARLEPFLASMTSALALRGRLALSEWVERTWSALGSNPFLSADESANAERFFALLDELELPGGVINLQALSDRLKKLYASTSVHPGAVDLMTIHGAKGLEWDAVFVPALERTTRATRNRLLSWLELDGAPELSESSAAHALLAPIQSKRTESKQLNRWMRNIESAREAAERKRLFYVACTRAREELHLFAAPQRKKKGKLHPQAGSLLASAWPAAEKFFENADGKQRPLPAIAVIRPRWAGEIGSIAAAGAEEASPVVERIPLATLRESSSFFPCDDPEDLLGQPFERPEGSFASRAFGNAVHAFLEQVALRRTAGGSAEAILQDLRVWLPSIIAVLRASGLSPAQTETLARRVLLALRNTLSDAAGAWILSPHPGAATESSFTSAGERGTSTVRLDRTFYAGEDPLSTGDDCLWVIDYKTAALGGRELAPFLAQERSKYLEQMQSYAKALSSESRPLRLALFYPLLPHLLRFDQPLV